MASMLALPSRQVERGHVVVFIDHDVGHVAGDAAAGGRLRRAGPGGGRRTAQAGGIEAAPCPVNTVRGVSSAFEVAGTAACVK
jgi:hypothetical protein